MKINESEGKLMDYRCEIINTFNKNKPRTPHSFLVAVIPVKYDFLLTNDCKPYAVIAANYVKDSNEVYGWIVLNAGEKQCIGDELLTINAKPNQWFECLLYEKESEE